MATSNRSVHSRKGGLSLAEELRQAIRNSDATEYRIAKDSGVPQPVVSRFMHGQRSISLETAAKLCQYLGLHLAPCSPRPSRERGRG